MEINEKGVGNDPFRKNILLVSHLAAFIEKDKKSIKGSNKSQRKPKWELTIFAEIQLGRIL